ncbi:hypothetical protein BH11BAC7_BH11BAC7_32180 [soil metagenome]
MKQSANYPPIDVQETLSLMPAWVKEKERRYYLQQEIAERAFGDVVEYIFGDKKKKSKKKKSK